MAPSTGSAGPEPVQIGSGCRGKNGRGVEQHASAQQHKCCAYAKHRNQCEAPSFTVQELLSIVLEGRMMRVRETAA